MLPHGFSYIGLLILIATMEVAFATTADFWHTTRQREKEEELLFAGDQIRLAIQQYYQKTPGKIKRYPVNLDDLLKDPRFPNTRRYLRKIPTDPMTGDVDWGLVRGPAGEIYGVHSRSEEEPIKKGNFSLEDAAFEGRKKYSEWQFLFFTGQVQQQSPPQTTEAAKPVQGLTAKH
ncbi:MAG TPA: type II secretion system protein [Rhodocyclaceae bacterium]|nr:type II secretion system protein [Rhodocyclaceae bacterium]